LSSTCAPPSAVARVSTSGFSFYLVVPWARVGPFFLGEVFLPLFSPLSEQRGELALLPASEAGLFCL